MKPLSLSLALSAAALAAPFAAPAAAQDDTGEKVNMVVVYGQDACPPSTDGEIVVCARQSESERYRIPESLRYSDDPDNTAWAQRVEQLEMVGKFGTMSCSPVGAGGFTGCTQEMIRQAYGEKASASNIRFSQLIDAAREERLSQIDEQAAEEQARVEQIERAYMEKLEKERQAETPDETAPPALPDTADTVEVPADPGS